MLQKNILFFSWLVVCILLFLYSFTQVDLNLTLSRASFLKDLQTSFQYIGYFQRPMSVYLYIALLTMFFGLYIWTLYLVKKKKIDRASLWKIIIGISVLLLFSYNAFSYDIFNYIFDAKIFTQYQLNPYEHKPQEFLEDPMLSFMHSVHRTYPYGPTWLLVTIPFSYLGVGVFLLTFFLFKLIGVIAFLASCYFLEKTLLITKSKYSMFSLAFFALNPLVIIESLVSTHNDIVMVAFALAAVYALLQKRFIIAFLLLLFSIGIKYATVFLLPIFIIFVILHVIKRKIPTSIIFGTMLISMVVAFIAMSGPTVAKGAEVQPWYFLNVLPFVCLLLNKRLIIVFSSVISLGLLIFYVPYLSQGSWPGDIISIKNSYIMCSLIIGVIVYFLLRLLKPNFLELSD